MTSAEWGSYIPNVTTGSGADKILPEFVGKSNDTLYQKAKKTAKRSGGGAGNIGSITKAIAAKGEEIMPQLNPGQQFIFSGYCLPAMLAAASPAEVDPSVYDESDVYSAGISSHESAERALSESCRDCAEAGADAAEQQESEGEGMLETSGKAAATALQVIETLGAFL